jgi:hypothetical protein
MAPAAEDAAGVRPFVRWALLVLACGVHNTLCACTVRARAHAGEQCADEPAVCLDWATVVALSPRWLSDAVGASGPLVSWLLLAPALAADGRTALLLDVVLCYLALIMPVRYTHLALPAGWARWDPSGHVFVYGAQLVPVWLASTLAREGAQRHDRWTQWALYAARAYALLLVHLSAMTAAFFHTLSESAAALTLVAPPLVAHSRVLGARAVLASERAGCVCAALWLLEASAAHAALRAQPAALARLRSQFAYDCALWGAFVLGLGWQRARGAGGAVGVAGYAPRALADSAGAEGSDASKSGSDDASPRRQPSGGGQRQHLVSSGMN